MVRAAWWGCTVCWFPLGERSCDLELGARSLSEAALRTLQDAAMVACRAGLPVGGRGVSPEEYEQLDVRTRGLPEGHHGHIRLVEIEGTDLNRGMISFVRNPHWKGPAPQIDGVEIHLYKNRDILALALQKGDVDIFYEYASSYPYANLIGLRRSLGYPLPSAWIMNYGATHLY